MNENRYPFQVQPLPYTLGTFSSCDPDTLYLHHHQYYASQVQELNRLVERHRLTDRTLEQLLTEPINLPTVARNNLLNAAGSVYNHQLYFDSFQPTAGAPPLNRLVGVLITVYGSMEHFRDLLVQAAESLLGAGWVWLLASSNVGPHIAVTENNQVVDLESATPLLVFDLWEHAYFLDNQFNIQRYIDTWFAHIDWEKANQRFQSVQPQR